MLTILCWVAGYLAVGFLTVLLMHMLYQRESPGGQKLTGDVEFAIAAVWPFVWVTLPLMYLAAYLRPYAQRLGRRPGGHEKEDG
jgi:hypothetical protein